MSGSLGRRSPDFRRIEHFIVLAQERNFTRAAHRLGLSQQALSASVRQLERDLGAVLVDRSSTPISLTGRGERFLQDVLPVRKSLRNAMRRARADAADLVTLGHTPAVRAEDVTGIIAPLLAARPELSLHAVVRFPDELVADVTDGLLDLALVRRAVDSALPESISCAVVANHRLRAVVAAGHPLAAHAAVSLAELAEHPMVVWAAPGESTYTDLLTGLFPADRRPACRVSRLQGLPPEHALEHIGEFVLTTGSLLSAPGSVSLPIVPSVGINTNVVWRDRDDLAKALIGDGQRVV